MNGKITFMQEPLAVVSEIAVTKEELERAERTTDTLAGDFYRLKAQVSEWKRQTS
ncbi:hypothetical protein [Risungbinella massiliensis]|uniref:hypothetical protein n=1 Tax=Risungbinella massiliensis TaxID=1329796 RepID=UPI0012B607B3|nr:hypothetical protein [Risungbinella massiliensis]